MKKVLAHIFVSALFVLGLQHAAGSQTELFRYSKYDLLDGHGGGVRALAFDAQDKLLASAGGDGVIIIRDLAEKREVRRLTAHTKAVNALAFRRDGRFLASASDDKTVRLWNLQDGTSQLLAGNGGKVLAVAFSPTGDVMASAGEDKQVILWSVETATKIGSLAEHKKKITHIFFLKDETLFSVGEDRMIIEWDVKAKRVLRSWQESAPLITSATASPNGNWLTVGAQTTLADTKVIVGAPGPGGLKRQSEIKIYGLASGGLQKDFDVGSIELTSLSISSDSNYLVAVHQAMTRSSLVVWDIKRGEQVAVIEQPTKDNLTTAAFSPNGQWMVSGNESGKISVWKIEGIFAGAPAPQELRGVKRAFLTTREPLFSFRQSTTTGILDLDPLGVEPSLAQIASEQIRARVVGTPNVRLIERQRIEKVMQEQKFQRSGQTDPVTAARIAKVLNISKIAFGSFARLGKDLIITIQLVDVETAGIEGIRQVICNGCADEDLTETIAFMHPGLAVDKAPSTTTTSLPPQPATSSPAPSITVTYPTVGEQVKREEIAVRGMINDPSGLASVKLEVSGEGGSRGLVITDKRDKPTDIALPEQARSYEINQTLKLAPGSNLISITAQNKAGLSNQTTLVVYRETEETVVAKKRPVGERWAFIVGISNYHDSRIPSLKFAHRDAADMMSFLQSAAGGSYRRENIVFLTDEQATWERVREELRDFAGKPGQDDLVMFYFAAHGAPDPYHPENVYLITHNTNPTKLAGTALSIREIELALRENLRARRVVILADTCHSGAFGDAGTRGVGLPADSINIAFNEAVRRSKPGSFILTSALGNEIALEGGRWGGGHGVFTWHLLQALYGKADTNGDGYVTADEVFNYVYENVLRDTDGKQHPANLSSEYDPKLPLAIRP